MLKWYKNQDLDKLRLQNPIHIKIPQQKYEVQLNKQIHLLYFMPLLI